MHNELPPGDIDRFKNRISMLINLDLSNYKTNQLNRRLLAFMQRFNIENLQDYYRKIVEDEVFREKFINMLTINVSEFFRNPEKFEELHKHYFPELLERNPNLKIWSAGCANGAEIYSIAMILDRMGILENCRLLATDFDKNIISKASTGIFNNMELETLPEKYKNYFKPAGRSSDNFQLNEKIIKSVKFEVKDLLKESFEEDFDLIVCRNVVIYFTRETNEKLYQGFYDSLRDGGILFIGSSERIYDHRSKRFKLRSPYFYQKV